MIDLRQGLATLFSGDAHTNERPVGFPVLYQRGSRQLHCACWDPRQQEARAHCTECGGSGWLIAFERHHAFVMKASQPESYPGLSRQSDLGRHWEPGHRFFFQHDVNPKVGDRICEVGWRGRTPVNLIRVHEINHVEAERGDGGRVEYFWAATRASPADFPFHSFVLRQRGKQVLYVPRFDERGEGL